MKIDREKLLEWLESNRKSDFCSLTHLKELIESGEFDIESEGKE